jgi:hypothetical protein
MFFHKNPAQFRVPVVLTWNGAVDISASEMWQTQVEQWKLSEKLRAVSSCVFFMDVSNDDDETVIKA